MRRLPPPPDLNRRGQSWLRLWPGASFGFLLTLLVAATHVSAVTFTASLDRDTVTVGESATLTLQFEGGQPKTIPVPPNIPNLQMENGGQSISTTAVNGNASFSISQTLVLTPSQPGSYTIPSLRAEVGGQILASRPLTLKALKADSAAADTSGNQLAFFRLIVPKKEVFVGEVFPVEFQCHIREGVANADNILQNFDAYNGCPIKVEGATVLRTAHAQRRRMREGDAVYGVSTLVTAISPVKAGPLEIGSMDVNLTLQLPQAGQRRRDVFDPFGMFQQYDEKRVTLSAEPQHLATLLLPRENVPANFLGAVGSYTMTVSAGPTNVAAGDPVTLRVQLTGHGALESLALPEQSAWHDFKTYPPTTKIETADGLGLQGAKTFEQVVVPQSADVKALPPLTFSYFDADEKAYRTLTQPALPLIVRPADSVALPTVLAANRASQADAPPAQDIVPNKQRLGAVAQIAPPLIQQPWFVALQGAPVLAYLAALGWRKRTDSLANNPRLRRQREVARILRQGLNQLRRQAGEKNAEAFFATLFHLLQEQLGERLDVPALAITEAVIDERLRPLKVPETVLTPLTELFQTCNLARYAPVQSSQELAALIPKLESVLNDLRNLKV